jgi:hypothetical protein
LLLLAAWPLALALCLAACKKEPDLPDDPHIPPVNFFIGVWKDAGGVYWQFTPNGTGGRAATQAGPFPNEFSFLFFNGEGPAGNVALPSLLILEGSPVDVTCYTFSIALNQAILTAPDSSITLERVSGSPQVVSLMNPLIGEWLAVWNGGNHDGAIATWSLKYYTDGTVKTYHHQLHQFENAYALRENTLVIFGAWRYSTAPVVAEISPQGDGTWQVTETSAIWGKADWVYAKVDAAVWKK